jgi:hypothetical protein
MCVCVTSNTQDTHGTRGRAQRHTDHADEPHSHPNPPTTHIPQTYTGRRTTVGGIDTHAPRARTRYRQATTARNTDWRCGRVARWTNTPRERIFKDPAPTPRPSYVRPSHTTSIGPHAGSSYNWPPRAPEQLLTTTTCPPCPALGGHEEHTLNRHTKYRRATTTRNTDCLHICLCACVQSRKLSHVACIRNGHTKS